MKKILIIALAVLASASFSNVDAAKRKKKNQQAEPVVEVKVPVQLVTSSDSLSYAAGMMLTNGLMPYLQQQLHVDTAYLADFVSGFNETVASTTDPQLLARRAGRQIGEQVSKSMLPRLLSDFTDTPDSIVTEILFRGFADGALIDTTVMQVAQAQSFFSQRPRPDVTSWPKTPSATASSPPPADCSTRYWCKARAKCHKPPTASA